MKFKGYLLAAIAAATYGTNPAFAVPLYGAGMNAVSVLLFRYLLGMVFILAMIKLRGRSLHLERNQILPVALLGILMALSSVTLFESYNYINSGVASTLLFVYPVFVAVIMIAFFHERFKPSTVLTLLLMGAGLLLLMRDSDGASINLAGFVLVMLSSVTYAVYMVMINVRKSVRSIATLPLLFYVLLFGSSVYVVKLLAGDTFVMPDRAWMWGNVFGLAFLPTVLSLVCTTKAIQAIGSTPTAIFGALEPVTAVVLSVLVLGQGISAREVVGGLLICVATTLVVMSDRVDHILLRMRRMFPSLRHSR
ncbi:MAG: DMT family transporter [Muribaculaceae bacterium]|nr:DMT family transporter [Muribaculaceae bacterium]